MTEILRSALDDLDEALSAIRGHARAEQLIDIARARGAAAVVEMECVRLALTRAEAVDGD